MLPSLLNEPQADPFFFFFLLVEWREIIKRLLPVKSGVRGGPPQEMPIISSLVADMSIDELRSFSQLPANIRLGVADDPATPTIGGTDNTVYFTHDQFAVGLRFSVQSLVKEFLHFSRAPPTLVH